MRSYSDTKTDQRISPASRAATENRANQIVAKVLENTPREFDGVGWPGCGVVDIVLLWGGQTQLIANIKFGALLADRKTQETQHFSKGTLNDSTINIKSLSLPCCRIVEPPKINVNQMRSQMMDHTVWV